ncbi:hypothetical protein AMTR_s00001p00262940 [Amborella trichopoda]|uniref:Uncharacterized protein n=1 Tax=Amborella trichopoda TaxID=13333 RepID=W1NKZ4_AMBTC|nr:hypothetical protein AMTR_s00001p00262940 [Amborella trichopoda]
MTVRNLLWRGGIQEFGDFDEPLRWGGRRIETTGLPPYSALDGTKWGGRSNEGSWSRLNIATSKACGSLLITCSTMKTSKESTYWVRAAKHSQTCALPPPSGESSLMRSTGIKIP